MGYSDTTVTHCVCRAAGLVSFYGPSFMAGFGENGGMFPYMVDSVRRTLFDCEPLGALAPNDSGWTVEHIGLGGSLEAVGRTQAQPVHRLGVPPAGGGGGGHVVRRVRRGIGLAPRVPRSSPRPTSLDGAILFLETSEEAASPELLARFIRSLAAMGCLQPLAGILLGRPGGQIDPVQFPAYADTLCRTVREEYGMRDLPIVSNIDCGHTDPMMVLPLGVRLRIDSNRRKLSIPESAVV